MPQLCGGYEAVAVFVEMPQALDEILSSVGALARANGLKVVEPKNSFKESRSSLFKDF